MKNINLKNDTWNEKELQTVFNYEIYPRDSIITTNIGFVNIDDGSRNGTHWTAFYVKDSKSYYFDFFGGQPDKFPLSQLLKP